MGPRFQDRRHAGQVLARVLRGYAGRPDVLVLGLPRGGVPVAFEIAEGLGAPLDVFLVRKLGVPGYPELGMGAIASGGVRVLNEDVVADLQISRQQIDAVAEVEARELVRREQVYREGRPAPAIAGRTVLLVDDGLATGATMRAAARALRRLGPDRSVVAVPIAAPETCAALVAEVDEVVCAYTPEPFRAVGLWYEHFAQTSDDEVRRLLSLAARRTGHGGAARERGGRS